MTDDKEARRRIYNERCLGELRSILGPDVQKMLQSDDITEILSSNGSGRVWADHRERGLIELPERFELERSERVLRVLAALLQKPLDVDHPEIGGDLPFVGHRVHGILPPVSPGGPSWSIRKLSSAIYPLEKFCLGDVAPLREILVAALRDRRNILITGGTGSGKTSFVNRLLLMAVEAADGIERHILCEDTRELKAASPDTTRLEVSKTHTLAMLVQSCLRLRPDRIVIGEVRGGEALAALKSWNTGTPGGFFTVHANSALDGLFRLEQLTQEAVVGSQHLLIGQTVDLVVHLTKVPQGPRYVQEIAAVNRSLGEPGAYETETKYTAEWQRESIETIATTPGEVPS